MSSICAECGSQVLDLKSHLKIHKDSKVECEVCGKVLTNRKAFRNHMQTHKSWTLKVHIILHHYKDYFDMTQKSMRFTNGEFVESTHYSIKNEERTHNFKVKRMMGTPIHIEKSKKSLVWHNSRRLGMTPPEKLRLRRSVHSAINI